MAVHPGWQDGVFARGLTSLPGHGIREAPGQKVKKDSSEAETIAIRCYLGIGGVGVSEGPTGDWVAQRHGIIILPTQQSPCQGGLSIYSSEISSSFTLSNEI